eukprot:435424_1
MWNILLNIVLCMGFVNAGHSADTASIRSSIEEARASLAATLATISDQVNNIPNMNVDVETNQELLEILTEFNNQTAKMQFQLLSLIVSKIDESKISSDDNFDGLQNNINTKFSASSKSNIDNQFTSSNKNISIPIPIL